MDSLDAMFKQLIAEQMKPHTVMALLTLQKIKKLGITIKDESQRQLLKNLTQQFQNQFEGMTDWDNTSNEQFKLCFESDLNYDTQDLEITDEDIREFEDHFEKNTKGILKSICSDVGQSLLLAWKDQAKSILPKEKAKSSRFNTKVHKIWGEALDLLNTLFIVCVDTGAKFNHLHRSIAALDNDFIFDALTRLHARGCQIGHEIFVLLSNGLADGAQGRWRTLHEVAATACFISEQGNDVAERFLLHSAIDTYVEMQRYQEHHKKMGWSEIPEEDFKEAKSNYDALTQKFGKSFGEDYGWAADALGKPKPNFRDIELNTKLEHIRPFFKMASSNVHATSKGIEYRLSSSPNSNFLVAGPSIFGLSNPLHSSAYSMCVLTTTVLLSKPDLDSLAFVEATRLLMQEIYVKCCEIEEHLRSG